MSGSQVHTVAGFSSKCYWYQIKVENFPSTFLCQSCRCIVPKLSTLSCGHWCCDVCLKGMRFKEKGARKHVLKCSLCRANNCEVSMTTTVKKQELEKKMAACPNNGCIFSGRIRDVKRHIMFCPEMTQIKCVKCNRNIPRAEMAKHLRMVCLVLTPLPSPFIGRLTSSGKTSSVTMPRRNPPQKEYRRATLAK